MLWTLSLLEPNSYEQCDQHQQQPGFELPEPNLRGPAAKDRCAS
jgi:hypothetical protein